MKQPPAPKSWYSIRVRNAVSAAVLAALSTAGVSADAVGAVNASSAEVLIYGDIGENWWSESVSAASFVRELNALDVGDITVRINTLGGSVPDGIAIYNAMLRHQAHVTTVIEGCAMSIGSLIALGGDTRQMAENAVLMVHAPWTVAGGNAPELRAVADQLDVWATAISASYASKTGKSQSEMLALLQDGKDHFYTAAEAQAMGFVDEVISAAPVVAMAAVRPSSLRDMPAHISALLGIQSQSTPAAAAVSPKEPNRMSGNTPTAAEQQAALAAAREQGAQAERQRQADISAQFTPFASRTDLKTELETLRSQCIANAACTPEAAGQAILKLLAAGVEPAGAAARGTSVQTIEDERDKFRAAGVNAIMARAAVRDEKGQYVRADGANPLRGRRMVEIAAACLQRAGVRTDGMSQMDIVAAAFTQSTGDFPLLLENTMRKTLLAAYAIAPDTWTRFCAIGSVSDFRPSPRYRVGSLGNLLSLTELQEFKNVSIPDGEKATMQAGTKGYVVNVSRQTIINDDLGFLSGVTVAMGRGAKRTIEADVYALLASNPVMADGFALFHANHGNLAGAGSAPSTTSFDAARQAIGQQKDVSKNDFLDLRPSIWLGPLSKGGQARQVNGSQYDTQVSNKFQVPNIVQNLFSDIVDTPRLSGTAWYAFADPMEAPVIEVDFLDGNQEPYLEQQTGFTVDGSSWKVRMDYGVGAIDFRGAYQDPGA
ncbi:Clp protease ClpP [Paucibacter sp. APW11]|uniref:ATP-dependent Clp protease proteolytic subunit n=1 Tax=Roseateles aquae TaxID=3077235 RepID=A0ABU3P704_9BURK|nr:ClpP-like prohead protease/major capsid protein fusion protein [Paucibacter sp. APW11]MDT8998356.1 Clp protease ClpP [Paucibacter sp. APW11]